MAMPSSDQFLVCAQSCLILCVLNFLLDALNQVKVLIIVH